MKMGHNLILSAPFVRYKYGRLDGKIRAGNICAGLLSFRQDSPGKFSSGMIGIYLPVSRNKKNLDNINNMYSDYLHLGKYFPDIAILTANLAYYDYSSERFFLGLELGPDFYIIRDGGDTNFLLHYGINGGIKKGKMIYSAEFNGAFICTGSLEKFSDRIIPFLSFGANLTGSKVLPGVFFQIPLRKNFRDEINGVLGVKLKYHKFNG